MKPANISKQRILGEVKKLQQEKLNYLYAAPLEDDLYNWHFTFQGPENTQFHEGLYHGQILLPYEYPFKPPDIVFMNKNGRFETNTKICLTITQYHPEEWNSAWTIRTMLEAVISLFAENVQGVGALTTTSEVRTFLAKNSHSFVCQKCGPIEGLLPPRPPPIPQSAVILSPQKLIESVIAQKPEVFSSRLKLKQTQVDKSQAPTFEMLNSKNNMTQTKRSTIRDKPMPKLKKTHSIWQKLNTIPNVLERQGEEEGSRSNIRGNEVVYVQDRLPIDSSAISLTKTVKLIQNNLAKLQRVTASMTWVD